jgi:TPP-dependent pyruvate/acetoin dehydrogenase alpha subunit
MNAHFGTRFLAPDGSWISQADSFNTSADVSPTGSQMPRLLGLGWASKLYREMGELGELAKFSHHGDEVAWGTIGNASCAEGMFWETLNAGGVLGVPMVVSIWDDGYGISVPNDFQITKGNLSELLAGFRRQPKQKQGYDLYTVQGWDYPLLCETYIAAASIVRMEHVPAIIHVVELTQPQGHSTSGSHERYKSPERLEWELEYDCLRKMREWMVRQGIATLQEIEQYEKDDLQLVREAQRQAWEAYRAPIDADVHTVLGLIDTLASTSAERKDELYAIRTELARNQAPYRRDAMRALTGALVATRGADVPR